MNRNLLNKPGYDPLRGLGNPLDDLWKSVQDTMNEGRQVVEGGTGAAVEKLIRSSEFGKVLDVIEKKAEDGVKQAAADNAVTLFALGAAAGALGGVIFRGSIGLVGAGLIAAWAAHKMMNYDPSSKKK